jgi:hypothetical protein
MALSIGGIGNPYGMSFVQPMNYNIKNQSEISDAFVETGMSGAVMNVPPVVYPNAQVSSTGDENNPLSLSADVVKKSQEANKMFNDVAQKFQGMTTGYSQNTQPLSYGATGSTIDLFA